MKASSRLITLLIAASIMSSCQDMLIDVPCVATQAILISPEASVLTKAPLGGTVLPSDRTLVMSAYHNAASGGTSQNYFSGVTFSRSGSSWEGGKHWPATGSLDLFAYSADGLSVGASYKTNVGQGVTLTVPDNSTAQTDILWGYQGTATSSSAATPLTMRHAEAALAFTAKAAKAYDAENNLGITITGITVNDVKCSGTVSLPNSASCSWSNLDTQKSLSLPGMSSGYDVPATAITIDSSNPFGIGGVGLIVIPQAATSVTVTYTAHNGRDGSGNAVNATGQTTTAALSGSWEAGKRYVLAIEFAQNVSISASVYEWTSGSVSVPVQKTVSATYSVSGKTSVELPAATLSAGSVVSVDWGDGFTETYQATSPKNVTMAHSYSSSFSGSVKLIVHSGTVDFGQVLSGQYRLFAVNEGTKVFMSEKTEFVFTVNSSRKKVKFAPTNLWYDEARFQFYFEGNDYDYPQQNSYPRWCRFKWSPRLGVAISGEYSLRGDEKDTFFASSGITVSGYSETWTVLSSDEWNYLISRALAKTSSGKSTITIEGVKCCVLKPDGFSGTVSDSYTAAQWSEAKEQYGLVALPFNMADDGTSSYTYNYHVDGRYWSGTPGKNYKYNSYSEYSESAYCASFNSDGGVLGSEVRDAGLMVRLVSVQ